MKRCPQCQFIYEDEQIFCDMDGSKLAFDSQALPNLQALTTQEKVVSRKGRWRSRIVPVLAAFVLGTVLFLVYYVSTHRQASNQPSQPAAANPAPLTEGAASGAEPSIADTTSQSTPAEAVAETPSKVGNPRETENASRGSAKSASDRSGSIGTGSDPRKRSSPVKASQRPAQTSPEAEPKKESKIGSFLKKTGRLLKKPFKL